MAYKIEDIDWSEMPEGAVEFMLEDSCDYLTWITKDGYYFYHGKGSDWEITNEWRDDDDRTRYKVSDYHPDMNNVAEEWDGSGNPPVGVKVNFPSGRGVVMLPPDTHGVLIIKATDDHPGEYRKVAASACTPVKLDREKWAESACDIGSNAKSALDFAEAIYDAQQSGELPAPGVQHQTREQFIATGLRVLANWIGDSDLVNIRLGKLYDAGARFVEVKK